jgi:hypothetical protein
LSALIAAVGVAYSVESDRDHIVTKYWEMIANRLMKAGWSWGCVSTVDSHGRTTFSSKEDSIPLPCPLLSLPKPLDPAFE